MSNIGIFGGTFNPPHVGHLIVIEHVRDQLSYDKIIFIPSANPPHKRDLSLAPAAVRFEMTRLATSTNSNYFVSDVEIERSGRSYSIDTLNDLSKIYPKARLSLIIGIDNLIEFSSWKSPDEILTKADLIVMSRAGYRMEDVKNEFSRFAKFINVPQIGISGTDIRRRVKLGHSIRYLVPNKVYEYIIQRGLYK